jgi:threonine/homoserine/homoserine lactone efflux protein
MLLEIIKAFIVGICASAPIGPIAILVIQKSLSGGHKAGFIAGLGACVVDTIYAVVAIFALAVVQDFIFTHQNIILIVGGVVVSMLGMSMSFSDPFRKVKKNEGSSVSLTDFMQSLVMGFSNPGAIFVILALFAFFGLADKAPHNWSVMPIILSVSAGSAFYWFFVTWLLSHFRRKFEIRTILWINRVTGAIVIIIGIALLGEGIFNVFFR